MEQQNSKPAAFLIPLIFAIGYSPLLAVGAESDRKIEETVVTAEKLNRRYRIRQSLLRPSRKTLSSFGIQNPDELVNYTPATTRDAFDIRIVESVKFPALGGDPGVATYYNGIFSPDLVSLPLVI